MGTASNILINVIFFAQSQVQQKPAKLDLMSDSLQQANSNAKNNANSNDNKEVSHASMANCLNQILAAIEVMKEDFVPRFGGLLNAIQGVQGELKSVTAWITDAEERISNNQDDIVTVLADNSAMNAVIKELVSKVVDLENRSRCSNLRLVGLPERKEGTALC